MEASKSNQSQNIEQFPSIDEKHPRHVADKIAQLESLVLSMKKKIEQLEQEKMEEKEE